MTISKRAGAIAVVLATTVLGLLLVAMPSVAPTTALSLARPQVQSTLSYTVHIPLAIVELPPPTPTPQPTTTPLPTTLQNGDFDGDWWRVTHTGQEYGEIFVPEHWVAFWKEEGDVPHDPTNTEGYGRPEMHVIRANPETDPQFLNPPRFHEEIDQGRLDEDAYRQWLLSQGWRALKYFTFWRIHDAGIYQSIGGLEPGTTVQLSAWAHAWSSNGDAPDCSEGANVGCGGFYALARDSEELELGDADRNFTFRLGIDPTGGTDPWAETVIWGLGAHIYNTYDEVPSLLVDAQSSTVTVFLRSTVLWPFKHCDAYWDDVTVRFQYPSEK